MKPKLLLLVASCFLLLATKATPVTNNGVFTKKLYGWKKNANSPPTFVNGASQTLTTCQNSTSSDLSSFLVINDPDVGQTLTWTINKVSTHGTLSGFPASIASNGGNVSPPAFAYTPLAGYSGADVFSISVNDGTSTVTTTINVIVNPAPTIASITGNTEICVGRSTTLSNATAGGTWNSSNLPVATIDNTGIVASLAAGSTTITYTVSNADGCSSVAAAVVTVSGFPIVSALTGTNTVCVGATTTFRSATANGVWTSSNTAAATVDNAGVITGVSGTANGTVVTIRYTVTNATGCATTVARNVRVFSTPTVNANTVPAAGAGICVGGTVRLTNTTTVGGFTGYTGTWSSDNTAVATVSTNGTVTGLSAGTANIIYTVNSNSGCADIATTTVTVTDPPVVDVITGQTSVCVGSKTTLSNTTQNGVWRSGNTGIATINSRSGQVTAITSGTVNISYTVTNTSGCSSVVNYSLNVVSSPTVAKTAGSNTTCLNSSITLTNSTANGIWTSSNASVASITNSGIVTGVSVGTDTIYYSVTNSTGCTTVDTFPLSIGTGVSVAPITGTNVICSGKTSVLKSTTTGGVWTSSDPSVAKVGASTGVVIAVSGGTATITYAVSGGGTCVGTATIDVTVNQTPIIPAINGATSLCTGTTTTLSNTTAGGLWTSSNNAIASVTSAGLVSGDSAGNATISYTVINAGGCSSFQNINITVNQSPIVAKTTGTNAICTASSTQLSNVTTGGVWASSDENIAYIDNTGLVTGLGKGTTSINYTVTSGNGCAVTTPFTLTVNDTLAVSPISGNLSVCLADRTATLTDATLGGTFASSDNTVAQITAAGVATLRKAGSVTITYTVTNGAGCTGSTSTVLTINANPTVTAITGSTFVCSGSTTKLSSTTTGGVWSSASATNATVDSSTGLVTGYTPINSVTISYKVTNSQGCATTVTSNLRVGGGRLGTNTTGTNTICQYATTQFANTTTGGTWSSGNTSIATVSATGLVTGISAGTATINYSVPTGGCPQVATRTITVNVAPVVPAITGTTTLCVGKSAVLANETPAPSGGTAVWSSSNASIATVNTLGIITGISAGTATITYTVTNASGCVTSATAIVTINSLPVIPAITGATNICIGKTSQLANTLSGGTWVNTNDNVATLDNNGLLSSVSAGKDTVKYIVTNSNGCSDSVIAKITVNALPVISAISASETVICATKTATLTNATNGGTWVSANTSIASVNSFGTVTGISAGTTAIKYIVTNVSGCSDSVSINITVNPLPVIGKITGTTSICYGKTTTLADTTVGGTWVSNNTAIATIDNAGLVNAVNVGNTTIRYILVNANGCSDSVSTVFTVKALPIIAPITGNSPVCVGSTITLQNATSGGTIQNYNPTIASIVTNGSNSAIVTGLSAGIANFTYTVTNLSGCTDSVSTSVTVNPLPVKTAITATNDVLCVTKTAQLSHDSTNGTWFSFNTNILAINNAGKVTAIAAGNTSIGYILSNAYGCTDTVEKAFTVNALPVIAAITGNANICLGKTSTLSTTTTGGVWASSNDAVATISNTGVVTAVTVGSTSIKYIVTNANGCTDSVAKTITVNAIPVVAAITGNTTICAKSTTKLADATTSTSNVWSSSNTAVATIDATGVVTGISAGTTTIKYIVTNASGCTDSVATIVTVNALPVIPAITGTTIVCTKQNTTLSNTLAGGNWTSNNTSVATIDAAGFVNAIAEGTSTIKYIVTNASGCTDSVIATVTVNALPVVAAITGNAPVCEKHNITLANTTTGGVWSSTNTSVATINASGGLTGIAAGTSTIKYIVTNATGCSDSTSVDVTVNALPVIAAITGNTPVCAKHTITLANATTGGNWSSTNTAVATINASGTVTGVAAGTTTIKYIVTNASGCSDSVSVDVTVNALPVIAAIAGNTTVCAKHTTALSNTTKGGNWSSTNTAVATINASGVVTAISAGTTTIKYIVTNASGCADSVSTTVKVNALPVIAAIAGNTTVCAKNTTTLTDVTTNGTWSSTNSAVATIDANGVVTGVSAGTSTIKYIVTNASGCADSVATTVTVNALPVIAAITGNAPICAKHTITLASATAGGNWFSANTAVATIDAAGVVTGVAVGTSTIQYVVTNASGCTDSVSTTVTVNALPVIAVIAGNTTLCAKHTTALSNATAGGNWFSADATIATIDAAGTVTGVAAGTTTIQYIVTNASACSDSVATTVTVNALPVIEAITGNTTVCAKHTTTLTNATTGGNWSSTNTAVATINSSGIVTGIAAGTTTIKYIITNASGCSDSVSTTVTVNALPVIAAIAGNTTVCAKHTTALSSTTKGGVWSSSNTTVATITASGVVTGIGAGSTTIKYIVTNASGCSDSVATTVRVNALPVIAAIAGNKSVCAKNTTTLTDATANGTWSSTNTAVATIDANGIATGIAAGTSTIKYIVANASGCSDSVSTTVTVNALPVIAAIAGNTTVCAKQTSTLTNATIGGTWSSANTNVATIDVSGVVTGITAGTSTITYVVTTNASGCTDSVATTVTVNSLPIAGTITGNTSICVGKTTTLSDANTGTTQSWSSANTAIATIDNAGIVTGIAAGSASVYYTVTNASGCSTTDSALITINALPTKAPITGNSNVCLGNTTTFSNATSGGIWSSSNTSVATIDANGVVTGITAGTSVIKYVVTNASGCTDSVSTIITVNPLPIIAAITGAKPICVGATTPLFDAVVGGSWTSDNVAATINNQGIVTGVASGTSVITYALTNSNTGCSNEVTTSITVNPIPTIGSITGATPVCTGSTITLANTASGGVWTSSNPAIATISNTGIVTGVTTGTDTIYYNVSDAVTGCSIATSAIINVNAVAVGAITGNNSLCLGSSATLTDTTLNGTWTSSNPAIVSIDNAGLITGLSAGNATVTYTIPTGNVCGNSATINVSVNPSLVIDTIGGVKTVCMGATNNLTNTTTGGVWTSSNTSIATIDNTTGIVTSVAPGTSTITYTVTSGANCTNAVTTDITVVALPTVAAITGNTTVCQAATTTLNNTTAGGTWSTSDATIATIDQNGIVTGVTAGSATITYTVANANGCTTTTTTSVTVNALPIVAAIPETPTICQGTTTTLTNTTANGVWSSSNNTIATINSIGLVTTIGAGIDTVSYAVTNNGCTTTVTSTVTVNGLPDATISGTNAVCKNATTTLTAATTGGTWTSSDATIATIDANGIVTGIAAGSATISYSVTNSNGCAASATTTVTVNDLPIATISGASAVCKNATTTLTAATTGGTWTSSDATIATIDANGSVTGIAAGSATITYSVTNNNGCAASATNTVTVNDLPIATISGASAVCKNATTTLTAANTGGTWTSSDATIATIDASGIVTGIAAGSATISYSVTNSNGCAASATTTVTVNDLPIATISGASAVCKNATTTLTAATTGGTWTSSDATIATIDANGIVTGIAAGSATITYSVTNSNGCAASATTTVTVNDLPIATISGASAVCKNATTTLTAATTGGTWTSSDATIATIDANGNITGIAAGSATISYSVTNSNGCAASATTTVTVNDLPIATISGASAVCKNATTTLTAATIGGNWTSSDATIATIDANGIVTGIAAGSATITYSVTNSNGCAASATTTVTVNDLPIATISGASAVCKNATTTLTAATTGGNWTSSDATIATIDANGTVTGIAAGSATITYSVTNSNGCAASATTTVTVNDLPIATISGASAVCKNATTTLTAATIGGTWTSSDATIATIDANGIVTGIAAGSATITYNISNGVGCTATGTTLVTVNDLPVKPTIIVNGTTLTSSETAVSYQWNTNGSPLNGETNQSYTYTFDGSYSVTITNASGCSITSDVFSAVLPIQLAQFKGQLVGRTTQLNWSTASEANAAYFEVQRSGSSTGGYITLGKVKANGTSSSIKNYGYNDVLTNADNLNAYYYRLKSVDNNGSFSYSPVVVLNPDNSIKVWIYPNPAHYFVTVQGANLKQVSLLDRTGRLIVSQQVLNGTDTKLNVQTLASGTYILQIFDTKGQVQTQQIVVQ